MGFGISRTAAARGQFTSRRAMRAGTAMALLLALAACKGGGSTTIGTNYGSPYAPPAPLPPGLMGLFYAPAQNPLVASIAAGLLGSDPRYTRQNTPSWLITLDDGRQLTGLNSYPLRSSGAAFAHAAGLTGAGATVAMSDTRLNDTHEVFSGKPSGSVLISDNIPTGTLPSDLSFDDHGTTVAGIIAGQSSSFIGVAPGANLLFGTFSTDQTLTSMTNAARTAGAVAYNNSWGFDSLAVGSGAFQTVFSSPSGQAYLTALDQYAASGVVVFAVSNNVTHTNATLMDALPYVRPSLEAGWIAVGNAVPTFSGSNVSSVQLLSSDCMEAARWCILADGAWEGPTTYLPGSSLLSNTSYDFGTGSSFAAPQVSGALALLAEAFPTLSPHELRVRLLASADNHFFTPNATVELATGFNKGYSYKYGLGFLDIEAALLPIGPTQMSLPDGSVQVTDQPVLVTGAALGDAVSRSLSNVDVVVTDILDAPFQMPGESLAATVAPVSLSQTLLIKSLSTNLASARMMPESGLNDPFAEFNGQTFAMLAPSGDVGAAVLVSGAGDNFGLNVKRALTDGATRLEVGLKLARDSGNVMGFGASGSADTNMASLQLGLTQDLGQGGFFSVAGELGMADLGDQPMITSVSAARFDSMGIEIGQRDAFVAGDRLAFGVGLPVAVTGGQAHVVLPVANSVGGASFTPIGIDLSPSDRQTDLSLTYQRPLSDNAELLAKLVHAENYGNRAGERDTGAVLAISFSF
jgi:subtilase-type serine protease